MPEAIVTFPNEVDYVTNMSVLIIYMINVTVIYVMRNCFVFRIASYPASTW